ncbi:MAG: hypothetical protein R2710_30030 [Acidimicrobiales bacterium]
MLLTPLCAGDYSPAERRWRGALGAIKDDPGPLACGLCEVHATSDSSIEVPSSMGGNDGCDVVRSRIR